eukprot:gene7696-859_t
MQLDNAHPKAYFRLATAFSHLGKWSTAMGVLERGIEHVAASSTIRICRFVAMTQGRRSSDADAEDADARRRRKDADADARRRRRELQTQTQTLDARRQTAEQ